MRRRWRNEMEINHLTYEIVIIICKKKSTEERAIFKKNSSYSKKKKIQIKITTTIKNKIQQIK